MRKDTDKIVDEIVPDEEVKVTQKDAADLPWPKDVVDRRLEKLSDAMIKAGMNDDFSIRVREDIRASAEETVISEIPKVIQAAKEWTRVWDNFYSKIY